MQDEQPPEPQVQDIDLETLVRDRLRARVSRAFCTLLADPEPQRGAAATEQADRRDRAKDRFSDVTWG